MPIQKTIFLKTYQQAINFTANYYLILGLFSLVLMITPQKTTAQCNPDEWIEGWYDWAKGWQNYALDQFPITDAEEMACGDTMHLAVTKDYQLIPRAQHPKGGVLQQILQNLAQYKQRKGINYTLYIIKDDKTLNAFSIAGGRIYITTRMINYANTLDELAFVIAHEIAHVEQKHAARKIQTIIASRYYLAENGDFGAAIANALTSPFGQIDEYQADRAGADLVIAAGYDARKGLDFFERMATTERYDSIEKMVRTHPYSAERYACLHDYLNQKGK